jgi:hypothetical protein
LNFTLAFTDSTTGTPTAKLSIEQNGPGGALTNFLIYAIPGGMTPPTAVTNTFDGIDLNPGAVVVLTDISTGSGASVALAGSVLVKK